MKAKILLFAVAILGLYTTTSLSYAYTADDFVITVDTSLPGTSVNNQFNLPTSGGGYDAIVDWGDGATTSLSGSPGDVTHTYATSGIKQIVITHNSPSGFPRIYFDNTGDAEKLLTIEQWGTNQWTSMVSAFWGCVNLTIPAADNPDLSLVTDMHYMFSGAESLNNDISDWDVSTVTDMRFLFMGASSFNQPLNSWDMSSAILLDSMFWDAAAFNQPLDQWDVSSVTYAGNLFNAVTSLSVENYSATLIGWAALPTLQTAVQLDVPFVKFSAAAASARQALIDNYGWAISDAGLYTPRPNHTFITRWDTTLDASTPHEISLYVPSGSGYDFAIDWGDGTVDDYTSSPSNHISHTYATSGIKTVTIVGNFPQFTPACSGEGNPNNKIVDVVQWGTQPWEVLGFSNCTYLVDFSASDNPDVSQLLYGTYFMFQNATAFNGDIGNWDMSEVTSLGSVFQGATVFDQDISTWDVSSITDGTNAFVDSGISTANYTKLLLAWSQQSLQSNVDLGVIGSSTAPATYCSSATEARDILINTYNWTFTDGGPVECSESDSGSTQSTAVGQRPQQLQDSVTTPFVTIKSFAMSVRNFLDYLTHNEEDLDNLTPEESKSIIVSLRDILAFLLKLLPTAG